MPAALPGRLPAELHLKNAKPVGGSVIPALPAPLSNGVLMRIR